MVPITNAQVKSAFANLCKQIGERADTWTMTREDGGWRVRTYDGRQPFGSYGMRNAEMYYALHAAADLLYWLG